uniref:Uncharacterized protein n=1 Tax=Rhizophora mucronata TaxID=61149 RepID=A0A2P2P337_RHIMU
MGIYSCQNGNIFLPNGSSVHNGVDHHRQQSQKIET